MEFICLYTKEPGYLLWFTLSLTHFLMQLWCIRKQKRSSGKGEKVKVMGKETSGERWCDSSRKESFFKKENVYYQWKAKGAWNWRWVLKRKSQCLWVFCYKGDYRTCITGHGRGRRKVEEFVLRVVLLVSVYCFKMHTKYNNCTVTIIVITNKNQEAGFCDRFFSNQFGNVIEETGV